MHRKLIAAAVTLAAFSGSVLAQNSVVTPSGAAAGRISGSTANPGSGVGTLNSNTGIGNAVGGTSVPGSASIPNGISGSYGSARDLNGGTTGVPATGVLGNNAAQGAFVPGTVGVPDPISAPSISAPDLIHGHVRPVPNGITVPGAAPLN